MRKCKKKSNSRKNRGLSVENLEGRRLLAQLAEAVPVSQTAEVNDMFTVTTNYSTVPAEETGGVSLRLHFNPSLVDLDLDDITIPTGGPVTQGSPFIADESASSDDGDVTTTQFVQVDFVDTGLTFPESLSPLFSAMFTATSVGTANFNYTFANATGDTDSTSASVTITPDETAQMGQIATASPVTQTAEVNDIFSIATNYSTVPGSQTGGVSLRLHFNPNLVSFDPADITIPTGGPVTQGTPFVADESAASDDGDASTTQFVQVDFVDTGLMFPESLTPLFTAMFTATAEGAAAFNYTFANATGETSSTPATVTVGADVTEATEQIATASPVTQTAEVNDIFTIATNYSTVPETQTGGVSLRLHFNPNLVSFDPADITIPTGGPVTQGTPFVADETAASDDGDASTTQFVQVDFVDTGLMFPESLTPLFTAMFTATNVGTANFNYTFANATGETSSTGATVTISEDVTGATEQVATASPVTQTAEVNDIFTIATNYSTVPDTQTGGVSLRLHFNPNLVSFDPADITVPTGGPVTQGTPFVADETAASDDGDASTTQFVQVDFVDTGLMFPESLTPLFTAMFTATNEGTANFNYTFANATGETSSTGATVTISEDVIGASRQIATATPPTQTSTVGSDFTIGTNYSTDPAAQTGGVSLRLHFNPSLVSFDPADITLPTGGPVTQGNPFVSDETAANDDGDATTTQFVQVDFVDSGLTFPEELSPLFNSMFTAIAEGTANFNYTFANATGETESTGATVTINAAMADLPTVSVAVSPSNVDEDGSDNLVYTFTRTGGDQTQTLTVDYAVSGTAMVDDFTGAGTSVTIPANQAFATVTVDPTADTDVEPDETVVLTIAASEANYTIGTAAATGTINNDDVAPALPTVSLDGAQTVQESVGTVTFTVELSEASTSDVTVPLIASGTASSGDFSLPSSSVVIPAGQTSADVTVNILDDGRNEPTETLVISLGQPIGADLSANSSFTITIFDDDVNLQQTRILQTSLIASLQVVPGDQIPTGLIFQAEADTTISVASVSFSSPTDSVFIVDSDLNRIQTKVDGVPQADVVAGGLYAILFTPQTENRVFSVRSSAGLDAVSAGGGTNLFQPTDTNADGQTTAVDALRIVNRMATESRGEGEQLEGELIATGGSHYDVNQDGRVSALDALLVINELQKMSQANVSPESEEITVSSEGDGSSTDAVALLSVTHQKSMATMAFLRETASVRSELSVVASDHARAEQIDAALSELDGLETGFCSDLEAGISA